MGVKTRHLAAQKSHSVVTSGKLGWADTTKAPQSQLSVQAMPGLVAVCQAELKGLKSISQCSQLRHYFTSHC